MQANGYDSAYPPNLTQATSAKKAGVAWWGGYLHGPGALHAWESADWQILKKAGIRPLPIWVPHLDLTGNAARDALLAVEECKRLGIGGVIVLDTEASMRSIPLKDRDWFVEEFQIQCGAMGFRMVLYSGGYTNNIPGPQWVNVWLPATQQMIDQGPWPNGAFQGGQAAILGLTVDLDYSHPMFPLAYFQQEEELITQQDVQTIAAASGANSLAHVEDLWNGQINPAFIALGEKLDRIIALLSADSKEDAKP